MVHNKIKAILIEWYRFHSKISILNIFKLFYYENRGNGKLIKIRLKDIRSIIYARSCTSDLLLIRNIFLYKEYPIFQNYQPGVIIDAGANIGLATVYFMNYYPNSVIYAIEPDKSNCEVFEKNVQPYSNITLLNGALLDEKNLPVRIINQNDNKYSFIICKECDGNTSNNNSIISFSINQLIQKYGISKIDLLKLDIEGSEKDVFTNNLEWLKVTDNILMELHEHIREGCSSALIKAIADQNFKISFKGENLILPKTRVIFK